MSAMNEPSNTTSPSLLHRVRARDSDAWDRFAAIYTPLVYGWARRGGLQESDAADVVQDVFRSVFRKIDTFQQEGQQSHFRGWLWAITRNRVRLFFRTRGQQPKAIDGSHAALGLTTIPDQWQRDDEPSTDGDRHALMHRALTLVKGDFSTDTWQAFWRLTIDGHTAAAIAADLGQTASAVRQAKYRVLCRLREEMA